MVEFSPREKYKEVKEDKPEETLEENTLSLEELREREAIEQKVQNVTRTENLEEQVTEEVPQVQQTNYETFTQQGIYDLKPEPDFFAQQREREQKEKEERQKRALL